jgi:ribokinase
VSEQPAGAVIVVGSANVDLTVRADRLPRSGETVTGGVLSRQPGGKGANQAVAAARYGARTWFVGAVGDDPMGEEILDGLRSAGVDATGVSRLPGKASGTALIVVDIEGENQIAVASGANEGLGGQEVERALVAIEQQAIGQPGSLAPVVLIGFEVRDEAVLAAARWAHERKLGLIVNPAPARTLPPGLADLAPILTPNGAEAAALTGTSEPEEAAHALHAMTGAPVVVTLGAAGAQLVDTGGLTAVPAPVVRSIDTTGAGDAFNGVLAAELSGGRALREAVAAAVVAGSLSTEHVGAQAGLPTLQEVADALRQVAGSLDG